MSNSRSTQRRFAFALDLRYRGQGYELTVPLEGGAIDAAGLLAAAERFHAMHEQRFAHADRGAVIETVALRLTATGLLSKPALAGFSPARDHTPRGAVRVFADGVWQQMSIYERAAIGVDTTVSGPLVIAENYSTIFLPRGWQIAAAATGDLVARRV